MKHMKRLVSLITAFLMVFGLSISVFAANITLTIENAKEGWTYTAYKLFDVTDNNNGLAYTISKNEYTTKYANLGNDECPFIFTSNGDDYYVSFKESANDADVAQWIITHSNPVLDSEKSASSAVVAQGADSTTIDLTDLGAGYYFINTGAGQGSLVMIDTITTNVTIYDKNDSGFDKTAVSDPEKIAGVGEVVPFEVKGTLFPNLTKYEVTDTMTNMEFLPDSFKVVTRNGGVDTDIAAGYWTMSPTPENSDHPTGYKFVLDPSYLSTINRADEAKTIVLKYNGKILPSAAEGSNNSAKNDAVLTYGNNEGTKTDEDHETVYNYKVVINKYEANYGENDPDHKLSGATFQLYQGETFTSELTPLNLKVVDAINNIYRLAATGETGTVTNVTTNAAGSITIQGLDTKYTYWLKETVAPAGFNLLGSPIEVDDSNINAVAAVQNLTAPANIANASGTELPETGGMGTTMLYIAGGILVLGAGILLITRRRMNSEN